MAATGVTSHTPLATSIDGALHAPVLIRWFSRGAIQRHPLAVIIVVLTGDRAGWGREHLWGGAHHDEGSVVYRYWLEWRTINALTYGH